MKTFRAFLHNDPMYYGRKRELWMGYSEMVRQEPAGFSYEAEYALNITATELPGRHAAVPGEATAVFASDDEVRAFLQPLVDLAAKHGIFPTHHGAEMTAQKSHLEDMRRLVFDHLVPGAGYRRSSSEGGQ